MPVRDDISQMLRYSSSMNFELIILKKLCKTCANFGLIKLLWKKLVSLHVNKLHHLTRLSKASKETKSVVNCMENGDSRSLHFPRSVACSGESLGQVNFKMPYLWPYNLISRLNAMYVFKKSIIDFVFDLTEILEESLLSMNIISW